MNDLNTLLRDADPLRQDTQPPDAELARIRSAVLRARPAVNMALAPRRRRTVLVAAAIACVLVVGLLLWQHASPVSASVRFEVRLAEERPAAGLIVAAVHDSRRLIYLHPATLVSNEHVAQAWASPDGSGRFSVGIQFFPAGAERMRAATGAHVGRPLAVLVDGRVVVAPVVRSPIADSATITGAYSQDDAQRIASGIMRH